MGLKLHGRLEEALVVLQAGQRMYAEQQRVLDAQQASIAEICKKRVAAGNASLEIVTAASSPEAGVATDNAQGKQAQVVDDDSDSGTDVGSLDGEDMAELARRAGELQEQLEALEAAAASAIDLSPSAEAARAGSRRLPPEASNLAQQATENIAHEAPRLLEQLQGLIAKKDHLEAQLRQEQSELEEQLHKFEQNGATERCV